MEVTYSHFCKTIADDFKIELYQKEKTYFGQFPIKNGARKIKSPHNSVIVDIQGNEYPYMLNEKTRNNDKLVSFDYIYVVKQKNLEQILNEVGIQLTSTECKICDSNGWYSRGIRYLYKDFFCEVVI
jgi:hypothetical protein